jgi:hypothetical protein
LVAALINIWKCQVHYEFINYFMSFLYYQSHIYSSSCSMEVAAVIYGIPWTCEEFCAVISYIVWNTLPCLFFFLICLYLFCVIVLFKYKYWSILGEITFWINLQGTMCLLSETSVGNAGRCCGNPRYSFLWPHRQRALYYSWLWWPMGGMASISVWHLCYYS